MSRRAVRILDFDGSVTKQTRLLALYDPEIIDLTDIAPKVRFWLNPNDREEIIKRIGSSDKSAVTFLGSGDFHHISEILISRFGEPMTLVDFDFHPDRSIIAPRYSCGSWVRAAIRNGSVLDCVQAGIKHGAVKDLQSFRDALKSLPAGKLYITIDKDCLTKEYALTNWHEGKMALGELLSILKVVKESFQIAGVDITGEYSPVKIEGMLKRSIAYFNRPWDFSARGIAGSRINELNEETNLKILDILT